mmetsp:Transcript_5649/g.17786  ORF Transcript_5649/g.17786 Transcript_5649/m.17786 type:complete len:256 (-) Transcript_5649:120-887(-)
MDGRGTASLFRVIVPIVPCWKRNVRFPTSGWKRKLRNQVNSSIEPSQRDDHASYADFLSRASVGDPQPPFFAGTHWRVVSSAVRMNGSARIPQQMNHEPKKVCLPTWWRTGQKFVMKSGRMNTASVACKAMMLWRCDTSKPHTERDPHQRAAMSSDCSHDTTSLNEKLSLFAGPTMPCSSGSMGAWIPFTHMRTRTTDSIAAMSARYTLPVVSPESRWIHGLKILLKKRRTRFTPSFGTSPQGSQSSTVSSRCSR